ncbi:unnamed protein product [Orchesella dallaii]|uniref:PDZ domain-containing protein n=1 Tax=Orchesella dallaii TaxID=48710 RepID=A0ABP1QY54_9HEXA
MFLLKCSRCFQERKKETRGKVCIEMEPQRYNVALRGHDFTGLGFNICGNMRDGIFVKDIMQRGPAAETKQILAGDQITGMTVSFKQMVLEDAITLLSYASPYEVNLEMLRLSEKSLPHKGIFVSSPAHPSASSGQSNTLERVCHPFFKSQSIDDLRKVGKEHLDLQVDRKKKQANGVHAKTSGTGGTIEIPTVVVVGNNENRSSSSSSKATSAVKMPKLPKMNFSFGSSTPSPKPSKAPEAHQKSASSSSSAQIQIPMPDEIDGPKGAIVSVTKPEIVPRTKVKSSHVQKSISDDMELVEAISPAIDQMTADFEKSKKDLKGSIQINEPSISIPSSSSSAVLDIQPVEINMTGQPTVQVETSNPNMSTKLPDAKMEMELPSAQVDVRAPSMIMMPSVTMSGSSSNKEKEKDGKKKEKSEKSSKLKSPTLDIDLTPPDLSLKGGIEFGEGESGDKEDSAGLKKPQRGQKTKDKAEKSKEKEGKAGKAGKEPKEKDSSDQQQGESSTSGEKSKFFKFGIPVLPDIGLNFGFGGSKSSSAGEDKDKDKEKEKGKESKEKGSKEKESKEKASKEKESQGSDKSEREVKETEPSGLTLEASLPKVDVSKTVEVKSPELSLSLPTLELKKDDKKDKEPKDKHSKDKEPKEKSSKDKEPKEKSPKDKEPKEKHSKDKESKDKSPKSKDKGKEKEEKVAKEKPDQPESEDQQKEKSSSSGFHFNIKLPSFDKPLLKRKDSSSSSTGEPGAEPTVEASPDAALKEGKEAEAKSKSEKSPESSTPSKSKKKDKSEKKSSSRPTSPDGHRTTDDEADKSMDVVDSVPGEKSSKKRGSFQMPHIGIKLPKFGHSKQTYSFENAGENKDLKHSHGPTAESLLEETPSMKIEATGNTAEFRKMTPTPDEIQVPEVTVKMEQPQLEIPTVAVVKKGKDEVDSADVKVEVEAPKISLPSLAMQMPSAEVKVETEQKEVSVPVLSVPEVSVEMSTSKSTPDEEASKEMKEKESPKEKESKPSFVSKGLKGLRDLKDKVAHKLSHDHTQHDISTSSEDEGETGDVKASAAVTKEKVKKEKKSKESRDKSKEEKAREKEEKAKEKERIKAEKKLKKAELKKKLSTAHSSSSSSSSSSSDESDADDGTGAKGEKKEKKKSKTKDSKPAKEKKKKDKKGEKSDKKLSGIEVQAEIPGVELQGPEITASSAIEKHLTGHEAKLIPAKPPVVPRKSRDSLKDDAGKVSAGDEIAVSSKSKLKKSKSKGDTSTSSSSSSYESDSENRKDDKEGKPKKPKRTPKRKAPEIPSIPTTASVDVPDLVKITTSAQVISPPKEESKKSTDQNAEMRESTPSKTPESGRRSASYGDLSSLQTKTMGEGPLERAMSMDMAGDKENSNEPGSMQVGSSQEDLSVMPDSKTITHLSRNQQHHHGLRDSIASKSSTSSCETLKASPTSVVQVHPKEQHQQELVHVSSSSSEVSQNAPTTTISVSASSEQDPHSSTIQKMMNETLSVMNNIVHEMDSPSLVKSAMSSSGQTTIVKTSEPQVTISTSGTSLVEKSEAEKVARETVDEIMVKARESLISDMSVSVTSQEHDGPKVSVSTGDNNDNNTMLSDLTHSLSADMEGGADSFSIATVKIQGMDGDSDEPVSVRNITVTNIKNVPKQAIAVDNSAGTSGASSEQVEISSSTGTIITSGSSDPSKVAPLLREDSKARLLQTVADANNIKVAPATPLRKDSSLSSSSSSVDSSPDIRPDSVKPVFSIETGDAVVVSSSEGKTNGKTIEISSAELDGIMMSHAEFLQKQAAATTSTLDDSLEQPDSHLSAQLKDTFDNWVYVEQKNAALAHEHTCQHSHSDPEPSTSSSNDDDDGPYSRNGALSPTTYRMETEYKFETSEMRVTSSPIPPEDAHVKSQSTVYSTTMTLPQKTVTQITLGDPVVDAGGRIVSKITLDTSSQSQDDGSKGSSGSHAEVDLGKLPKLESLK